MTNDLTSTNRFRINFLAGSGARTIEGSTANTFYDFGGSVPAIFNSSGQLQTINFDIVNGNSNGSNRLEINAESGGIVIGGDVSASGGNRTLAAMGSSDIEFSGLLTNGSGANLAFSKEGSGTTTLKGTNSYSGATLVTAGKLLVNGEQSAAGGAVTVSSGAKLGGSGSIGGATAIEAGGIHSAGDVVTAANPSGAGTIDKGTFSSGLTYEENSIFEWNLTADSTTSTGTRGNDYDAVNASSLATDGAGAIFRVVLNGGQNFSESFWDSDRTWSNIFTNVAGDENLSIASIFGGGFEYRNANGAVAGVETSQGYFSFGGTGETHTLNWTAVPEPTSALAGLLLGAGLLRRRRAAIMNPASLLCRDKFLDPALHCYAGTSFEF